MSDLSPSLKAHLGDLPHGRRRLKGLSMQEIREALLQRNLEHQTEYYILVNESQALDLASGTVPLVVEAMARSLCEWEDIYRRRQIAEKRKAAEAADGAPKQTRRRTIA